jgi:hypothetical protein
MKPSSSSSLLLSAGRQHEPILVKTATPCGGADIAHHWQSSSSSLQPPPLLSSQSSSSTVTLFQLVATSATVGSVAALLGLASLDAHLIITVHTTHNGGAGGIFFALAWSGLTALAAYLIFERILASPKSKAAASTGSSSILLVDLGATDLDETTYRLLRDDEPHADEKCEHEPSPPHHAEHHDSRCSTVFVWGTYVSFSITCLVHDVLTTTTTTTPSIHAPSPHYYWWYGAVTMAVSILGTSLVVLSHCTSPTATTCNHGKTTLSLDDDDDDREDHIAIYVPVTV